jgi:type II secretory pathway pseudopilin PulG
MQRAGFTLVEAVVSTAIVTIAGSALLLGIASAIETTDMVLEQTLAEGMAQQLMDEIAGCRYAEPGAGGHQTSLGPESGEALGDSREAFDDLDDYHGLSVSPPCDPWGVPLGQDDGLGAKRPPALRAAKGSFQGWQQRVEVYYANPTDFTRSLTSGQTSDYRVVRVSVYLNEKNNAGRLLAQLTRVFSYVPQD